MKILNIWWLFPLFLIIMGWYNFQLLFTITCEEELIILYHKFNWLEWFDERIEELEE